MADEQARLGERSRALSDSIRIVYEKAFTDSIGRVIAEIRANALTLGERTRTASRTEHPRPLPSPREGERRVVVVPFAGSQSAGREAPGAIGDHVADSLRTLLAGRGTLMVVPESTTREIARAGRGVPSVIGTMLEAPAVITGDFYRRRDSLVVRMRVTCLTCGSLGTREAVVPLSQPMDAVDRLYEPLVRDLNRVRWTPVAPRGRSGTPIPLPPGTRVTLPSPPAPPPD